MPEFNPADFLRTSALIVSAHPYCARESHATSCHVMHRARARYKNEQMIRQMAIATALLGFNDLFFFFILDLTILDVR